MAKNKQLSYNDIPDLNEDWGLDPRNGLRYSGESVQKFIKEKLNSKMGYFHYDATSNRYLCFADEASKDAYVANPTLTELVLGAFDAPFNYEASITLLTPSYNAVFLGSTGNYIDFTFDIKNKEGNSTGENVNVTYTFIRNANKKVVTEVRKYGESVHLNIDEYLLEGANTVIVGITGQTSLAATTAAVTYQVVNLTYSDDMNIAQVYDLSQGNKTMEVFFSVSGYGTKIVEWFLDGEQLDFVKSEDEVVDVSSDRTKYIELSNLASGVHTLQSRAYTVINGEKFYTSTLYREILVNNGDMTGNLVAVATELPQSHGIVTSENPLVFYGVEQYIPYEVRFATRRTGDVTISLGGEVLATVTSTAGSESLYSITSSKAGTLPIKFSVDGVDREVPVSVNTSSLDIEEITNALTFDFRAIGKSNASIDKDVWSYGEYTGTFSGFNWNASSGWVNNALLINSGASFSVDIAPLANNATSTGKTLEFEFSTRNVEDDDAVVCDLTSNGVGLLITASEARLTSAAGEVVSTRFKAGEVNRIAFVINRKTGVTFKGLAFIYVNGILSGAVNYGSADNFLSSAQLSFNGTEDAQVELRAMRFYDTALSPDNILNNYILYRDTLNEMMEVYYRNEIYEEGTQTFSPDLLLHRLPVMIITGDIPTLEAATSTSTQILVDIVFVNEQDPTKNFTMKNVALRIQGTSSLAYPRKNFRFYTQKEESTVVYDAEGNVIESKLYSFKDGAQPVDCWCLKADFAESSGTHNTGIARIWNKVMTGAIIQHTNVLGEEVNGYELRTEAQKAALGAGYEYDVRTTIDGFPIVLFYKKNASDTDLIFLGKYNFNNDKSTPSVFGFENIPDFDNSRMQCWETKDNGHPLGLFTDVSNFDSDWSEAFESRYPDTKTPNTADLKAFSVWMNGVSQEDFVTEKWAHMDVYKVAAYYCYLMRFGAVDQPVKNAFLTSEDGEHFFFINYDNDTINGLINTGHLVAPWNTIRTTLGSDGEPYYAGRDSRLWNLLEADAEFMAIVRQVDEALYVAGLRYDNVIKMFDEEQAGKWVERVYNQDAQYKYIGPYAEKGVNNLFMLQGNRSQHRKFWLAKRFSYFDSIFVSGAYKAQAIEIKCIDNTPAGQKFTITAGTDMDYGYGINNVARASNITLDEDATHTFTTEETVNRGDPIRIYAAPNIKGLDLSAMTDRLAVVTIDNVFDASLGTKFKELIIGNPVKENTTVEDISGITRAEKLEYLDVRNMKGLTSLNLSNQKNIQYVDATGSNIANIEFAKGAALQTFKMPIAMQTMRLEQLPYLSSVTSENNFMTLRTIVVKNCPYLTQNFKLIYDWRMNTQIGAENLELEMTGVQWSNITPEELISLGALGSINIKGKAYITAATQEQIDTLTNIFGVNCFEQGNDFQIIVPDGLFIGGLNEVRGGKTIELSAVIFAENPGSVTWSIISGSGASIQSSSGLSCVVSTTESTSDRDVVVQARHVPSGAGEVTYATKTIKVTKVVRATSGTVTGPATVGSLGEFKYNPSPSNINEPYSVEWSVTGDAATAGYVNVKSQNNESCQVQVTQKVNNTSFNVVATVNNGKSTFSVSKSVIIGVKMVLNIYSNQSGDESTFANVKATVKYGSSTTTMGNGDELNLAANTEIKITFPAVSGYKAPNPIEFVIGENDAVKAGTYQAEQVEVRLSATDGRNLSGTTVKINGTQYTWSGTPIKVKIAFDQSYTIEFSRIADCFTPAKQTITASQVTRTVIGSYEPLPEGLVLIDQSVKDPTTMISGDINSSVIQAIRAGSHRYLGKYTADGQMTLCQLDDADSTKYADGTDAVLTGAEGDVFMKMPDFWYRAVEVGTDMWGIQFQLGSTSPGNGWIKWDTNALIGVYEAYSTGSKLYSRSGVSSSGSISQANFKAYARARGTGFQIVDWQMHCVMAILYYAEYGHTNCQEKIGAGTSSSSKQCGQTNACGMNDTKGTSPVSGLNDAGVDGNTQSINFWGLENWWGNKYEWIDNVVVDAYEWKITEPDGTVRTPGKAYTSNNYITKMMFGDRCDLIPTAASGSETTGFCDYYYGSSSTARVVLRSSYDSYSGGGVAYVDAYDGSSYTSSVYGSRLAFRGQCVEAESVASFKSLTAIG